MQKAHCAVNQKHRKDECSCGADGRSDSLKKGVVSLEVDDGNGEDERIERADAERVHVFFVSLENKNAKKGADKIYHAENESVNCNVNGQTDVVRKTRPVRGNAAAGG